MTLLADENEKTVFVAGVGPRTGTTLVQRIINSHPDAWIWGEIGWQVEECLTKAWKDMNRWRDAFKERDRYLYKALEDGEKLEFAWSSAIVPPGDRIWQAWRAFFEVSFRTKRIWGFKAITCEHLNFIRHIFPAAKIIVTARSPMTQYKSYRTSINGNELPDESLTNLVLAYRGYLATASDSDLFLLLDDFNPEEWVEKIFQYIDESVPPNALRTAKTKVRGPVPPPLEKVDPEIEKMIHRELDPLYQKIVAMKGAAL